VPAPRKTKQPPYARLPKESEEAYEAFLIYRDMGKERTIEKIIQTLTKSLPVLKSWSAKHGWVERARVWDNHLQAEKDKLALEDALKWEARRLRSLERRYERAQELDAQAKKILDLPTVEKIHEERYADGRIKTIILRPMRNVTKGDAAKMFAIADRLERESIQDALPRSLTPSQEIQGPPRIIKIIAPPGVQAEIEPAPDPSLACE
jgi:hypothetical protein